MRTRELFASLTLKPQKLAIYTIYRREVITPKNCKHMTDLRMKYTFHSIKIDTMSRYISLDIIHLMLNIFRYYYNLKL